jgi:hypothetical protein
MKRIHPDRVLTQAEGQARHRARRKSDPLWRAKHVEQQRAWRYMKKYGITVEQFDAMVIAQKGLCAACGHAPTGRLHVDHDHETERVRGLLCLPCNMALGFLESPLRSAWDRYLATPRLLKAVS